ncbi:hypothetical protein Esti_004055 [Eimeria stiedai]
MRRKGEELQSAAPLTKKLVGLCTSVQTAEELKSPAHHASRPAGLGFFGEPLWSCAREALLCGPFGKAQVFHGSADRCAACNETKQGPDSSLPLPPALFLSVALFLDAEDVKALASVSRRLRWLAHDSTLWRSLCFSEHLAALPSRGAVGRTVPVVRAVQCCHHSECRGRRLPSVSYVSEEGLSGFGDDECNVQTNKHVRMRSSAACDKSQAAASAPQPHSSSASGGCQCSGVNVHSGRAARHFFARKEKICAESDFSGHGGLGVRCRGLQVLPGCSVEKLVDWRFVFLLNRLSSGPRIHVRVRDLELSFPLYPVVPEQKSWRCPAGGGETPVGGEGQGGGGGEEQEKLHLGRGVGTGRKGLNPSEFVATFIQRAINIRHPMRLRHLRPGGRPGLCVLEIVRDQHYLLEWKVPLHCLFERAASCAAGGSNDWSSAVLVWPLPPYSSTDCGPFSGGVPDSGAAEKETIYSYVDDEVAGFSVEAPEPDAVDERLFYDVLDRGSGFATLLSPLSNHSAAAAVVGGALLAAVATASATVALTTAAAAVATLAVRHTSVFRGDLHVIERDEHEDDQEGAAERESTAVGRLAPSFSGPRILAAGTAAAGSFEAPGLSASEAGGSAHGPPGSFAGEAGLTVLGSGGHGGEEVGASWNLALPCLQRLLPVRLGRMLVYSTVASLEVTEASLLSATAMLATIATAAAALTTTCAAFVAELLPLKSPQCLTREGKQSNQGPIFWVRRAGQKLLGRQVDPLTQGQQEIGAKKKAGLLLGQPSAAHFDAQTLKWSALEKLQKLQQQDYRVPRQCEVRRRGASEDSVLSGTLMQSHAQNARKPQSIWLDAVAQTKKALQRSPRGRRRGLLPSLAQSEGSRGRPVLAGLAYGPSPTRTLELSAKPDVESECRAAQILRSSASFAPRRRRVRRCTSWAHADEDDPEGGAGRGTALASARGGEPGADSLSSLTRGDVGQPVRRVPGGWQPEDVPFQPRHGLLLFVRVHLPQMRGGAAGPGVAADWCCSDAAHWEALPASCETPEDMPLLLPTDATAGDLVRLLVLTLMQRHYVLPISAAARSSMRGHMASLRDAADSSESWRRRREFRGRSSSPTPPTRQALLHFWLASTQLCGEPDKEQPLPSTKLLADVRLMSCERLSLSLLPFGGGVVSLGARTRSLTVIYSAKHSALQEQRIKPRRVSTGAVKWQGTLAACRAAPSGCAHASRLLPSTPQPWAPSWPQASPTAEGNRLMVVMSTPKEGEPIFVLRREGGASALACHDEPLGLLRRLEGQQRQNTPCGAQVGRPAGQWDQKKHDSPQAPRSRAAAGASRVSSHPGTTPAGGVQGSAAADSVRKQSSEGTVKDDEPVSRSRIVQASLNSRQFEFHPQRPNVMLIGNNDGRVRLLDWERDVVLGTKLVDSHPILGLSWLNHHPELFVCAAGVSGIPYVVRWREEDDSTANRVKGDCPRQAPCTSTAALPAVQAEPSGSLLQRHPREVALQEASREDQYMWDREDVLDTSTISAALTWFRSYGRGSRMIRGSRAPLRIVHQYSAREELSSVAVNCTDDYLLVSGRSPDLTIHDVATGARLGTLRGLHAGSINGVRFAHTSPHLFVTASFDQTCRLWDLRKKISGHQPLLNVETGSLSVMCCFDNSDEWLLCSGVDAALRQVCLRSSALFPESFAIPPVNAETNFRRAVYLQGGKEFITAGTEEGFFRVFSRCGRDMGVVGLEGMLHPLARLRSPRGFLPLPLPLLPCDLMNLHVFLRSHVVLGLSAMGDAAMATATGVSRSSVATALRIALRHFGSRPAELVGNAEALTRLWQAMGSLRVGFCFSPASRRPSPADLLQEEAGQSAQTGSIVEEYVQSLRAHPHERRLVGALLAAKDQVETASGELSFVAISMLPSRNGTPSSWRACLILSYSRALGLRADVTAQASPLAQQAHAGESQPSTSV